MRKSATNPTMPQKKGPVRRSEPPAVRLDPAVRRFPAGGARRGLVAFLFWGEPLWLLSASCDDDLCIILSCLVLLLETRDWVM